MLAKSKSSEAKTWATTGDKKPSQKEERIGILNKKRGETDLSARLNKFRALDIVHPFAREVQVHSRTRP